MLVANAAVIGTSELYRRVEVSWHLRRLEEDLTAAAIIVHFIGDQHSLKAMLRTALDHEDAVTLKDDLRVDALKASATERNRSVIEKVRTCRRAHGSALPLP